jgi:N-acyl-L-homoserine lactone synthetase
VEIKVARYQAQKKYQRRKNIGFDKIAWKLRWRVIKCRKNNGFTKISVLTKQHGN